MLKKYVFQQIIGKLQNAYIGGAQKNWNNQKRRGKLVKKA